MSKSKYYLVSGEVLTYPYDGQTIEPEKLLSEKICLRIISFRQSNSKRITRIIIVVTLGSILWFSKVESANAIGLPMPATPVVTLQPRVVSEGDSFEAKIAKIFARKNDQNVDKSNQQIVLLMYFTDPRLSSNQQVLELVKELRGGNLSLIGTAAFLGLIILIFSMGEGFVPNNLNPGWGLDRPNPFQPPTAEHRYPPDYDLFFPRRTCYADRPGGSQIMAEVNPQSSREELTQLSEIYIPSKTQIKSFLTRNKELDLKKCLQEVYRRAKELGCEDFESVCSLERFTALATEDGQITARGGREAISILQGEMLGYYKDAIRLDNGPGVLGLDYGAIGLGEFENITHVEVKNPVGSAIKITNGQKGSISKQGKKIGAKLVYQQNYWSNTTKTSELENLNPTASLPQSPDNVLGVVDNFDVPSSEKAFMEASILKGAKNNTNIIFLNNN